MIEDDPSIDADASTADRLTDPILGDHPGGPHRNEPPFPAVAAEVREWLGDDSSGHDMHHVWRVFRLGVRFADDLGADREVVGAAALPHDLHRVMGDGTRVDPEETLDEIRGILARAEFPTGKCDAVCHCVAVHDGYEFRGDAPDPGSLDAKILRDADNLDAMGAVGVGRTFAFGGVHGTPLWDPEGIEYSQLYHFEDKLLRLKEELHTEPARELAAERHDFLAEFHERFRREWNGEA